MKQKNKVPITLTAFLFLSARLFSQNAVIIITVQDKNGTSIENALVVEEKKTVGKTATNGNAFVPGKLKGKSYTFRVTRNDYEPSEIQVIADKDTTIATPVVKLFRLNDLAMEMYSKMRFDSINSPEVTALKKRILNAYQQNGQFREKTMFATDFEKQKKIILAENKTIKKKIIVNRRVNRPVYSPGYDGIAKAANLMIARYTLFLNHEPERFI